MGKERENLNSYLFVKFDGNWADEMNVNGFKIFTRQQWDDFKKEVNFVVTEDGILECYFGTNQSVTYDSYKQCMQCYNTASITKDNVKLLKKLFGNGVAEYGYGHFPSYEDRAHEIRTANENREAE